MRKSKRVVKADPVVDEENADAEEEAPPSKKVGESFTLSFIIHDKEILILCRCTSLPRDKR